MADPWQLAAEEMASLSTWDDGSYHCPCPDGCVCADVEKVHLFDAVAEIKASTYRAGQADAWDECCKAVAWSMENSADLINAPLYAARNNPYRLGDDRG